MDKITDDQLRTLYTKNWGSHTRVARESGIDLQIIHRRCIKLGLKGARLFKPEIVFLENLEKVRLWATTTSMSGIQMAEKLGLNYAAFKRAATKNLPGIKIKKTCQRKYQNEYLINLWYECYGNYSEMSKKMGLSITGAARIMKDYGLYADYPPKGRY